jgi:hypothetical protein
MRLSRLCTEERGSASLEFVTAGLLLLVPLVYLMLAMSSIQAGALAVEGAARQAARVYVQSDSASRAKARAKLAVEFALADHGIDPASATITISCHPHPNKCLTRKNFVTVSIDISVPLPLAPSAVPGDFAAAVPLHSTATQRVSRFWGSG